MRRGDTVEHEHPPNNREGRSPHDAAAQARLPRACLGGGPGVAGTVGYACGRFMLNVGRRCTLACTHCHLSCSPQSTESMDSSDHARGGRTGRAAVAPSLVDVTGSWPKVWPHLRELIDLLRERRKDRGPRPGRRAGTRNQGAHEPRGPRQSQGSRARRSSFADRRVELLASMPGHLGFRGRSFSAATSSGSALRCCSGCLPSGTARPYRPALEVTCPTRPRASSLRTRRSWSVVSRSGSRQWVYESAACAPISNVPVGRFGEALSRDGGRNAYVHRLADRFNPLTVGALGCRTRIEVAWDGRLYNCDFNLGAGLPVGRRTAHG